jgi:hypothetical protein
MNKYLLLLLILGLLVFSVGCDTELGHSHENHDHDGDGVPDHTVEEHHEGEHSNFEKEHPPE